MLRDSELRVNTLKATREEVIDRLQQHLEPSKFLVAAHPSVHEAVLVTGNTDGENSLVVQPRKELENEQTATWLRLFLV